jgi:uncharacterized protein (DUF169 family)
MNEKSKILKESLMLFSEPVGVKFYKQIPTISIDYAEDHRFCQLIMRARKGESLMLTPEHITCPAAAAALGFKPLPEKLKDGSMLQGYGIFEKQESAMKVMEEMPRFEQGKYKAVVAKPLSDWEELPDVIIIEDEVEKLMWLALAYLNDKGGRLNFSTSILQAMCVDSTIIPFVTNDINMSFGCYGCRDATDAKSGEAILGFPGNKLDMVIKNLKYLKSKAIDRSREKLVYKSFCYRIGEN